MEKFGGPFYDALPELSKVEFCKSEKSPAIHEDLVIMTFFLDHIQ
jgi:hypothetical protein